MALTLGSVTVAADGSVTKSGECGNLYDKLVATVPAPGIPAGAAGKAAKTNLALMATAFATWGYTMITNARARVAPQGDHDESAGLQRTPSPNDANTATVAPGLEKLLKIV